MKMGLIIGGIIVTIVLFCGIFIISTLNGEVRLRNRYDAQFNEVETSFDNMWKTISQTYQVNEKYRETFIDGLEAVAAGRTGGSVFKSSTESSSQLGLSEAVFSDVMAVIEGERDQLKRSQDTLTDIWREHKTYCEVFPKSIIVGGRVMPKPEMISSSKTKDAISNHKEDDIDLK